MSQNDFDTLRNTANNLNEKFEDLVVEFANIRRLIRERLAPDQIAKLEEIIQEASRLDPLLKRLALFSELSTEDRFATYGARPEQYRAIIEMDGRYTLEELRERCRQLDLPASGDKKELCFRLVEYEKSQRNSEKRNEE